MLRAAAKDLENIKHREQETDHSHQCDPCVQLANLVYCRNGVERTHQAPQCGDHVRQRDHLLNF